MNLFYSTKYILLVQEVVGIWSVMSRSYRFSFFLYRELLCRFKQLYVYCMDYLDNWIPEMYLSKKHPVHNFLSTDKNQSLLRIWNSDRLFIEINRSIIWIFTKTSGCFEKIFHSALLQSITCNSMNKVFDI